jgi:hypothetical protein
MAVSTTSLELSIHWGEAIWLEAMEKGQHGVATWRKLDQLWVVNMSCCLVSSNHERWIKG